MKQYDGIFNRAERLLGSDFMQRAAHCRVIIFGVGGVGSWCAEGLVRSGIGHLTLVDSDCVSVTNINRQRMATGHTVGRPKVEALREQLLEVNPEADIAIVQQFYSEENASQFQLEQYDYVIDAIDSLASKVALILHATSCGVPLFSSMGAALKFDPTAIRVAEFWNVKGCPLARALRQRFKKEKTFPKHKFQCVYSEELLANRGEEKPEPLAGEASMVVTHGNGSLAHITAIYGFTLSGLILRDLARKTDSQNPLA